jgi:hypothetical protein
MPERINAKQRMWARVLPCSEPAGDPLLTSHQSPLTYHGTEQALVPFSSLTPTVHRPNSFLSPLLRYEF